LTDNRVVQRRREQRYEVWESVVISLSGSADGNHRPATIVDISKSGYRVLFGTPLAPGTEILTTLHSVAIFGVVRHCQKAGDDTFTAGVEITRVVGESEALPPRTASQTVLPAGL
jgi:c-di-GMP-binding flagellar brake protein YcgR